MGAASGIAYAADTLFVADANRVSATPENHRVLLFKNLSSQLPPPAAQLDYNRKCPVCLGQATVVLGQPNFTTTDESVAATQNSLRQPTAVASDGVHVVVADTNHNRVLIWNSIPSFNDQPADVVVGQPNFTSASIPGNTPNAQSMRGPQGVWIQNGRLYVADTQNNRVLIYNRIPTTNGAAADVVLGQPNFTTFVQPDLTQQQTGAQANLVLNPVSVTSDGTRLFVTDLGYNRVLIWNSIPSRNQQPADVVVGQPDMTSAVANNSFSTDSNDTTNPPVEHPVLCTTSNGKDSNGNPTYPPHCNATLNFPRFALSDGTRLFVADGGNDRVLVFQHIPVQNGQSADYVIGQLGGDVNQASDAADSLRTPMGLAWDGTNLYVSDVFNRRITAYSIGANNIPYTGVRNAASMEIFATGSVTLALASGDTPTAGDSVTITIGNSDTNASSCTAPTATDTGVTSTNCGTAYTYKIQSDDTLSTVVTALVNEINNSNSGAGDPNVLAFPDTTISTVLLTARVEGSDGNKVTYSPTVSTNATITATGASANLQHGGDASQLGPGTTVSIMNSNGPLSDNTASADPSQQLPTTLGGTQVYINGIRAPLLYVSPTQINTQIPWEVNDTTSVSVYVRSQMNDGSLLVTTPVAVTIVAQNPGIYTYPASQDPKPGVVLHAFSQASGVVLVDGTVNPGDVAQIKIEDRAYSYTVQSSDTLDSIRDALVAAVNQDPKVTASANATFSRNIILKARVPGPDGNGIAFSATTTNSSGSAQLVLTPTNTTLCCANVANSPVTQDNPAIPGETILIYATGLGLPVVSADNASFINTGAAYPQGGPITVPVNFVSSLAGGKTANVLYATLKPGTVGTFEVALQLNSDMPTDPFTELYIAQDVYVSNIVTFAVVNPSASGTSATTSGSSGLTVISQPKIAAIVNAASYYAPAISPGENIVIFGSGLGPASLVHGQVAGGGTLETYVSNTQVLFDGVPAPITYVMNNQTSVMVPYEVNGKSTTSVQVIYNGVPSDLFTCNVAPQAPGIYTTNFQGSGQGAILNQDGVTVNSATAPAAKGSAVSVYMTGEGMTTPASVTGRITAADGSGLKKPVGDVSATIGGVPAAVEYAGSAPGMAAGIAQINVRIPADAPSGAGVPIVITIGGASTQSGVTLAVQ